MSNDKHYPKSGSHPHPSDQDDETGSATGGNSGHVEFKDFLANNESVRDDLLSPDEKKQLLLLHKNANEASIIKQKKTREQRDDLKSGKIPYQAQQHGMGLGADAEGKYKSHPILSNSPRISDRQVELDPNKNIAETNDENRNELENQYTNRHQPKMGKGFNPQLRPN